MDVDICGLALTQPLAISEDWPDESKISLVQASVDVGVHIALRMCLNRIAQQVA